MVGGAHRRITAIVADDEEAPREQLKAALAAVFPRLAVVAECANGADAWDAWLEHQPAVCFLDIRMPGLTGIEVAQWIAGRTPVAFVMAYGTMRSTRSMPARWTIWSSRSSPPASVGWSNRSRRDWAVRSRRRTCRGLLDDLAKRLRKPAPLEFVQSSIGREVRMIRVDDLIYFEADARYTRLVHDDDDALIAPFSSCPGVSSASHAEEGGQRRIVA